ncbi:uncharacterized protein LOC120344723 [Styela clava]
MGSCCSSNRAATVGVDPNHKAKDRNNITENTGISNGTTDPLKQNKDSGNIKQNPSFTITPKYTQGVNAPIAAPTHGRSGSSDTKTSSAIFPTSGGYKNTDSRQQHTNELLSPNKSDDITLSTPYNNTDHLRASPYLSSLSNRKQYNTANTDANRFTGFDAPVANTDSENDFDSDIEKDVKVSHQGEVRSPSNVSLSSLLEEESGNVPNPANVRTAGTSEILDSRPNQQNVRTNGETQSEQLIINSQSTENKDPVDVVEYTVKMATLSMTTPRIETSGSPKSKRKSPTPSRSGSPRPRSEPDPIMETLEDAFFRFARYGEVNSEGREMNNKNWAKLCRDCDFVDNRTILTGDVDVIFSRHKPKGQRLIDFDMFVKCLEEIADRKYKAITDDKNRRRKVFENVIGKAPEYVGITGISKTGNVGRMTDHSLYPAGHKMRFDEEGRGLGVEDLQSYDPTEHGYVQGYKDKDTYDLKLSRPSSRSSLRPVSREASNLSQRSNSRLSPQSRRRNLDSH